MTSIVHVWMAELRSLSVGSLDSFLADIIVDLHTMRSKAGVH